MVLIRPWRMISVVRARRRALRWSAGSPSLAKPFRCRIISREEDLERGEGETAAGVEMRAPEKELREAEPFVVFLSRKET